MQLKYGLKKEWMEFFGTKRWLAVVLPALFFIIADPLMAYFMPQLLEAMGMQELAVQFPPMQTFALQTFVADFLQTGVLALTLALMRTAGGDQKNRTCVIPICSGFRRPTYILAKFILYPAVAFIVSVVSYLAVYGYTSFLYDARLPFREAWMPLLAFGIFFAFAAVLMLAIGCMTGKGGISAVIIFIGITFVSTILSVLEINRYNPLALMGFAGGVSEGAVLEYWVTLLITAGLSVGLYFVTAAVFRRKRLV